MKASMAPWVSIKSMSTSESISFSNVGLGGAAQGGPIVAKGG